jgi:AcrR family transcriptional regulator
MDPDARRAWVARVALDCLRHGGFGSTTFGDVARMAGLTEGDVEALFGDNEGLLRELVAPLLAGIEDAAARAATLDPRRPSGAGAVMAAYVHALLDHRPIGRIVMEDRSAAHTDAVRRLEAATVALRDGLARGIGGDVDHRIRAAAAVGAVQAAVLDIGDDDPDPARDVITDAAMAILLS